MWHGSLTDVRITCPGRRAANEALVTPRAGVGTASLTGTSALPLASGRSHAPEPGARRSTRSVSPTRTQYVFPLLASVMTTVAPARRAGAAPGQPDGVPAAAPGLVVGPPARADAAGCAVSPARGARTEPQPTAAAAIAHAAIAAEMPRIGYLFASACAFLDRLHRSCTHLGRRR